MRISCKRTRKIECEGKNLKNIEDHGAPVIIFVDLRVYKRNVAPENDLSKKSDSL
jgi:hypothetical protein